MILASTGTTQQDKELRPYRRLYTAVILQAASDRERTRAGKELAGGGNGHDAELFFRDWRINLFAELAGVRPGPIRRALPADITKRKVHL